MDLTLTLYVTTYSLPVFVFSSTVFAGTGTVSLLALGSRFAFVPVSFMRPTSICMASVVRQRIDEQCHYLVKLFPFGNVNCSFPLLQTDVRLTRFA